MSVFCVLAFCVLHLARILSNPLLPNLCNLHRLFFTPSPATGADAKCFVFSYVKGQPTLQSTHRQYRHKALESSDFRAVSQANHGERRSHQERWSEQYSREDIQVNPDAVTGVLIGAPVPKETAAQACSPPPPQMNERTDVHAPSARAKGIANEALQGPCAHFPRRLPFCAGHDLPGHHPINVPHAIEDRVRTDDESAHRSR